jgi:hypothetical protein
MILTCIDNYKDLCTDIDVQQCIISDIENELIQLQKLLLKGPQDITGIDYSRGPGSGQVIHISMDRIIDRIDRIERRLAVEKGILDQKKKTKKKIDEKLKGLTGLEYKVRYMKDIGGKTLKEIAKELGYSYDWIREVNSKTHKHPTLQSKTT